MVTRVELRYDKLKCVTPILCRSGALCSSTFFILVGVFPTQHGDAQNENFPHVLLKPLSGEHLPQTISNNTLLAFTESISINNHIITTGGRPNARCAGI